MSIIMDGVAYRVRVKLGTLEESFRIEDGDNAGTAMSGDTIRDVVGTYYDHTLEVEADPEAPGDYDAFFQAISAPVESHSITLPHQNSTITYEAMVTSGRHTKKDRIRDRTRWTGLKVEFVAKKPQRIPG